MSAFGTKRTSPSALHMSAFDPKRTLSGPLPILLFEPLRSPEIGGEYAAIQYWFCHLP